MEFKIYLKNKLAYIFRNILIANNPRMLVRKNRVNLHWWSINRNVFSTKPFENLGDWLSVIVLENMLSMKDLSLDSKTKETKHLLSIGSIIGFTSCDATVWGSGIIYNKPLPRLKGVKLDVRSVRGPLTREILLNNGYNCPEIYGDPAVLVPLFYKPTNISKKEPYLIIPHYKSKLLKELNEDLVINILTKDYKRFIDRMVEAEFIISSSLHGIILAEAYGIPAILLNDYDEFNIFKYNDYYLSTGRKKFYIANSIDEAIRLGPTVLPDLKELQQNLIENFPYDLWLE